MQIEHTQKHTHELTQIQTHTKEKVHTTHTNMQITHKQKEI